MGNLYTEEQYKEYSDLCEGMANIDDMLEGLDVHFEIEEWISNSLLNEEAIGQMDKGMEEEFNIENKKYKEEGKNEK